MSRYSSISDNLRLITKAMQLRRISLGITQKEAAKRAGIAPGTLKRFEQTGEISLKRLLCLLKLYDMDTKIVPQFQNMSWWTLEQIERAENRKKA